LRPFAGSNKGKSSTPRDAERGKGRRSAYKSRRLLPSPLLQLGLEEGSGDGERSDGCGG